MKQRRTDPNARMDDVVSHAGVGLDINDHIPLSQLDRAQFAWWIDRLQEAETSNRRLRGQLEAILAGEDRRCPVCDKPVTGRADQKFCGGTCRQRACRTAARASA